MALPCFNTTLDDNVTRSDPEDGSAHLTEIIRLIILDIAVPVVCALGLLGNLLSLVVLATERMHRTLTKMEISAHIGLIALAVSDFLFCLFVLIFTQITPKPYYEEDEHGIYFELLANGLITIFIIASTWLIVVMAAERYIAVCHPLRARELISLRRTRVVIFSVFILCCLSTVPIFLERTIVEVRCSDGRTVYEIQRRSRQSVILRRILWALFFDFIPCIALIYFNTCLIVQIRKAKKLRDGLTHRNCGSRSLAVPSSTKYRRKLNEDSSTMGGQNNSGCSQSLLRSENSCLTKQFDCTLVDYSNKAKQLGKSSDTLDPRRWSDGPGADGRLTTPRTSSSGGGDATTPHQTPRLGASRSIEGHYNAASKLNNGDHVFRRAIKTSTVQKRPSDSALNSVTATLVAVVILFLILVSPCEILKFSLSYTLTGEHRIVQYITNFMQVTNFSLNFVLYCAVNKSFRYTLRRLAFCCWHSIKIRF